MNRMLAVLFCVLLSAILTLGCDGGSDSFDAQLDAPFATENTVVLTGVVAMDEPLRGAVQAINTWGETSDEVLADANGRFSLSVSNRPPFLLRMIHDEREVELFSFAAAKGHVNVTPLTDLVVHVAVGVGADLSATFHDWDGSQLSSEAVQMAADTVHANFASLLKQHHLDPATLDFFQDGFQP